MSAPTEAQSFLTCKNCCSSSTALRCVWILVCINVHQMSKITCIFGSRMEVGEWKGIEPFNNDPSLNSESTVLNREGFFQTWNWEYENLWTQQRKKLGIIKIAIDMKLHEQIQLWITKESTLSSVCSWKPTSVLLKDNRKGEEGLKTVLKMVENLVLSLFSWKWALVPAVTLHWTVLFAFHN